MSRPLATLLLSIFAPPLLACSCDFDSFQRVVERSDKVFRGTITRIEYLDPENTAARRYRATLKVVRVWRGNVTRIFTMHASEPSGGGECRGITLKNGNDMLVFGTTEPADDHYLDGADVQGRPSHTFWYGWLDLLPRGQLITSPSPCSLTTTWRSAERADLVGKLGKGQSPTPNP